MNELPRISIGAGNAVKKGNAVGVQIHVWLDRPSPDPIKVDYVGMLEYSAWGQKWWYGESFGTLHLAPNQTSTYVNLIQVNPAPSSTGPAKMISGHQVYTVQLVSAVGAIPVCSVGHAVIKGGSPPLFVIGQYILEANPDVTPDGVGDLLGEVGSWRLYDNARNDSYHGHEWAVCTASQNADYVAMTCYDNENNAFIAGKDGEIICPKIEGTSQVWFADGTLFGEFLDSNLDNEGYNLYGAYSDGQGSISARQAPILAIGDGISSDGTLVALEGEEGYWSD